MPDALQRLLLTAFGRLPAWLRRRLVRWGSPSYTVGAMCLIRRDDGRILLIQQRYRRRWGLPGGLLGRREEPSHAVRREVREEVGLDVRLQGEPSVVVEPRLRRVDIVYSAVPTDPTSVDTVGSRSPEIVASGWFATSELPELQEETAAALAAIARSDGEPLAGVGGDPGGLAE